jgi:hypothetical protein
MIDPLPMEWEDWNRKFGPQLKKDAESQEYNIIMTVE